MNGALVCPGASPVIVNPLVVVVKPFTGSKICKLAVAELILLSDNVTELDVKDAKVAPTIKAIVAPMAPTPRAMVRVFLLILTSLNY